MAALAAATLAVPAVAKDALPLADLRAQDQRLLRIAEPIMAGNARLCDRTMPDLGVALQSTDQYPAGAARAFAAPVAFAAVLPGSAAAQAGIERDDGLLAIDGKPVVKRPQLEDSPLRDSAFDALAAHDTGEPLKLAIAHGRATRDVTIPVKPECRALVEILADNGTEASSDGRVIQIDYGLAARASDDQLAAIFSHELAHAVLHHRERLSTAGVSKGLAGEFGRGRRLNLQAEIEADRLSVYLLANAGLDPNAAPGLWRSKLGRRLSGGIFHDREHLSAEGRAKLLESEIAEHLSNGRHDDPLDLIAGRDKPMK